MHQWEDAAGVPRANDVSERDYAAAASERSERADAAGFEPAIERLGTSRPIR